MAKRMLGWSKAGKDAPKDAGKGAGKRKAANPENANPQAPL